MLADASRSFSCNRDRKRSYERTRTADLLITSEIPLVCPCFWLFVNYLQIDKIRKNMLLAVRRRSWQVGIQHAASELQCQGVATKNELAIYRYYRHPHTTRCRPPLPTRLVRRNDKNDLYDQRGNPPGPYVVKGVCVVRQDSIEACQTWRSSRPPPPRTTARAARCVGQAYPRRLGQTPRSV